MNASTVNPEKNMNSGKTSINIQLNVWTFM